MEEDSLKVKEKQPAGLYLLFATEMWERFSYYAMRGLFVLYLVQALGFEGSKASNIYGSFTSLIYLAPILGGFIADRYWGQRRAIIVGGIFIAAGQFCMGIQGLPFLYTAMGLIIIGTGLFKPNISTIVGELYKHGDPRRDSAFTIFYMGINLGAFLCNLIAGTLGEKIGWRWGFWTAGIGILIGLAIFIWGKEKYLQGKGKKPKKLSKEEKAAAYVPLTKQEYQRIAVIFILAFFSIFFWSAYEQAGASLNLFAYEYTDRVINIFGHTWEVPATWFQSLTPLYIILLAPVFSKLWIDLAKHAKEPSTPAKFMIALWLLAAGYGVMVIGAIALGTGIKIGMYYLALTYLFHTLGELCLSPVGLSMVTKLAPAKFVSMLMGVWFLSNAAANKVAGLYSSLFGKIDNVTFFAWLVVAPMLASFVLMTMIKPLKRWMHNA